MNDSLHSPSGTKGTLVPARGFWFKALGVALLMGSVGLVSCQALFSL